MIIIMIQCLCGSYGLNKCSDIEASTPLYNAAYKNCYTAVFVQHVTTAEVSANYYDCFVCFIDTEFCNYI